MQKVIAALTADISDRHGLEMAHLLEDGLGGGCGENIQIRQTALASKEGKQEE